jgi:hypothetical protein
MNKLITLILLTTITTGLFGQVIKVIDLKDTSIDDYYVVEPKGKIKGAMILLPGGNLEPESIFPETKLHNVAYLHNILVVALSYGKTTIYLNDSVLHNINSVLIDLIEKYEIPKDKFVIGGFSAGGVTALSYTEYCKQYPDKAIINPQAVFTADSPVDLVDVWYTFQRELKKNYSQIAMNEAKYYLNKMQNDLNGTPEDNLDNYIKNSPFYNGANDGGNAKYLLETSVRLYHDPDIVWQLKNRRRSLFDMNILCASAMINYLLLNGNDKAELVIADRPAMRSHGFRHPHSWSIIEEVDCVLWIKKSLGIE